MKENGIKKEWKDPEITVLSVNENTESGSGGSNLDGDYENS